MFAQPTTTVSILGGEQTSDDLGDPVESQTVLAAGVPASIMEQARQVTEPNDMRAQTVRFFTGRLPSGTVVSTANRILDERTGQIYVIDSVANVAAPTHTNDIRLDLRRA